MPCPGRQGWARERTCRAPLESSRQPQVRACVGPRTEDRLQVPLTILQPRGRAVVGTRNGTRCGLLSQRLTPTGVLCSFFTFNKQVRKRKSRRGITFFSAGGAAISGGFLSLRSGTPAVTVSSRGQRLPCGRGVAPSFMSGMCSFQDTWTRGRRDPGDVPAVTSYLQGFFTPTDFTPT